MRKQTIIVSGIAILLVMLGSVAFLAVVNNLGTNNQNLPTLDQSQLDGDQVNTIEYVKSIPSSWLNLAVLIMALTTLVSVSITFYLYRWRRILLSKPELIVPEEWGRYLENVSITVNSLTKTMGKEIYTLSSVTSDGNKKISNMIETFMDLQTALDSKDAEIRRLKNNYDAEIFRRFLLRFIRVDQAVYDFIQLEKCSKEQLLLIKRLIEDALDECGVERFSPEIGADYRVAEGVGDNPKTMIAEDPEDQFKIASILQEGYRLRKTDGFETISPAKVKIFTND